MGIAVRMTCLDGNDGIISSVLSIEADLVHVDMNSFYHLFQYCLLRHSLTAMAILIRRPAGHSVNANDVDSAVISPVSLHP